MKSTNPNPSTVLPPPLLMINLISPSISYVDLTIPSSPLPLLNLCSSPITNQCNNNNVNQCNNNNTNQCNNTYNFRVDVNIDLLSKLCKTCIKTQFPLEPNYLQHSGCHYYQTFLCIGCNYIVVANDILMEIDEIQDDIHQAMKDDSDEEWLP